MSSRQSFDQVFSAGMDANERRAAAQRAEQERADLRHSRIAAQASPFATPQERIRLWEDLYGLSLPRSPDHKLVSVIACRTGLTIREVHAEQTRRRDMAVVEASS